MRNIEGFDIDVQVKRVRTLRLSVRHDGLVRLTVPYGMPMTDAEHFVQKNKAWIAEKTTQAQERTQKQCAREAHRCVEGEIFTYLGQNFPLHIVFRDQPVSVNLSDGALFLICPQHLQTRARLAAINAWYSRELQAIVDHFITHYLAVMHEQPLQKLRFRRMTSRWGSCKPSERTVCLNLRLIFYPLHTIEAVVVHELVHLKEQSHNAHFHALMRSYLPQYKEYEKPLKE